MSKQKLQIRTNNYKPLTIERFEEILKEYRSEFYMPEMSWAAREEFDKIFTQKLRESLLKDNGKITAKTSYPDKGCGVHINIDTSNLITPNP